ncbi:MAG: hypothetical protein MR436_18530 [Eubacterium sp.]|nr:hypothetical protein [Eubacterium sp.]
MLDHIKSKITDLREEERRTVYTAYFSFQSARTFKYSEWMDIIRGIPVRDEIRIFLESENEDSFIMHRHTPEEEYRAFIGETLDDEMIFAKIEINKKLSAGHFSIYRFQKFAEDITSLPTGEILKVFSMFLNETETNIVFELFDSINIFYTKTMFFLPLGNSEILCSFNRKQRLLECRDTSCFYNQDAYELLPDDFKIEVGYEGNPFKDLFLKMETVLAASLIASNAMIQDGQMKLQIMGQRSVEYTCRLNEVNGNPVLYKIYDWIYSGGSSIDKAIIARNIICLHCKYEPLLSLDIKVLSSIHSNYNLYLKDNVAQYLELKNKVAEFISDIASRTGEYATELLDKFKANMIAVFGFLFSVVIADIVSDQPLDNIFTKDITVILELILAGSVVYLIICYGQSKYQIKKVYDSYENLKKIYDGILTEDDIRECFQNDCLIQDMKKTIGRSEKIYLFLWIAFLVALFVIVESISEAPVISPFLTTIVGKIRK